MSEQGQVAELPPHIDIVFNHIPLPLSLYNREGTQVAMNDAHAKLWNVDRDKWVGRFNFIQDEQLVAIGSREMFKRVMQGETIRLPAHNYDTAKSDLKTGVTGQYLRQLRGRRGHMNTPNPGNPCANAFQ